jgi:Alb1
LDSKIGRLAKNFLPLRIGLAPENSSHRKRFNFLEWANRRKVRSDSFCICIFVIPTPTNLFTAPSIRSRNVRRQATPPLVVNPAPPKREEPSGLSRVNKELANLIARKDPILNKVKKKSQKQLSKQQRERMEAKMVKAAAKVVISLSRAIFMKEQLEEKTAKSHQRGKEIKKRKVRLVWIEPILT